MTESDHQNSKGPSAWYKMKTRPRHLPENKQRTLDNIVATIRRRHEVEMIILFGSHARGDWVEDEYEEDDITYEYRSDYDILVVTADKSAERRVAYDSDLKHELEPGGVGSRVNAIVHTIHHVNQMLAERRFFFMDILKEGYLLYDSGRYKLARPPKELPPAVMLQHAEAYFEEWLESADGFLDSASYNRDKQRPKIAAFLLHQAAERYINCLLLVQTGYRPKEHDMEKLFGQAAGFEPGFSDIFPVGSSRDEHLFSLLRRAYVDARYNKNYHIKDDELSAITQKIETLKSLVKTVCEQRIGILEDLSRRNDQPVG